MKKIIKNLNKLDKEHHREIYRFFENNKTGKLFLSFNLVSVYSFVIEKYVKRSKKN